MVDAAQRTADLRRFYHLLDQLELKLGGKWRLNDCDGRMKWPHKGVYFFFEPGEERNVSGTGLRVVRVGTHAVSTGSKTSLWNRLKAHKGSGNGGGNHRGSIFRLHVGNALLKQTGQNSPTWGHGQSAKGDVRQWEHPMEVSVSDTIGQFPFLWLEIDDAAGANSLRAYVERHSIALLSAAWGSGMDLASDHWLGKHAAHSAVVRSGLWNVKCIEGPYEPEFLEVMSGLVEKQSSGS